MEAGLRLPKGDTATIAVHQPTKGHDDNYEGPHQVYTDGFEDLVLGRAAAATAATNSGERSAAKRLPFYCSSTMDEFTALSRSLDLIERRTANQEGAATAARLALCVPMAARTLRHIGK